METEYAVKISLAKYTYDNSENPFYWSLLRYDTSWHQIAFGWEISPQKCFSAALKYYYETKLSI